MSPVEVSREVLAAISHTYVLASYATPELRSLFNDWLSEIERLITEFVCKKRGVNPDEVARRFGLQRDSVIFILGKLTREGKISMQISDNKSGKIQPFKRKGDT